MNNYKQLLNVSMSNGTTVRQHRAAIELSGVPEKTMPRIHRSHCRNWPGLFLIGIVCAVAGGCADNGPGPAAPGQSDDTKLREIVASKKSARDIRKAVVDELKQREKKSQPPVTGKP